jgi:uncharacterized protein
MGTQSGFEWPLTLDVPTLVDNGWNPIPFREFIVKINSRCDLSCDYCYMYEMADQSWRDQPRRMSAEIAQYTAMRIGEHVRTHQSDRITLILHGGEPLLAGRELISYLVGAVREATASDVQVEVRVQTNAVGLDDSYLRLFCELGILIGVSLDGTAEANDRHRRFASGRGSHTAVSASLHRLTQASFRHLFSGMLCTIDLRNDPIATYEALAAFKPPRIDFLLPHGTWAVPPPGRRTDSTETPYADWLIAVFDYWYSAPTIAVRLFEDAIHLILGGTSSTEVIGLAPSRMVVIETDGAIEQADTLKAAYHGAAHTGLHVISDSLDAAMFLPGMVARQLGKQALSAECRACSIHRVCGGGHYAHRYRPGAGFLNPSVYCPDLMRLITHIRGTLQEDIDVRRRARLAG